MSRRLALAAVLALAACDAKTGGSAGGPKLADSGTLKGSAGGFSAQMASELAKAGIGDAPVRVEAKPVEGGSSGTKSGETKPGETGSGETTASETKAGSPSETTTGETKAGGVSSTPIEPPGETKAAQPPPGQTQAANTPAMTASGATKAPASRAYVKPAVDIAAIKLDLEPNWERDMGEAGTFSLVVKVPSSDDSRVFSVRYGYEDGAAPIDCDQYRKFLEDRGAMKVTLNRQKGGACYIEGTDQAGVAAFRMMTTYGGKRLLCHGSLYKDPASAALGDLRDKVLMQAKKICETLAL